MIRQRLAGTLRAQFGRPRGPLGYVAGRIMERRNRERAKATVQLLDLAPDARVLELGHGPGLGLGFALAAVPEGSVVGLEHSETMSRMARRNNLDALEDGRLELIVADAEAPPSAGLDGFDAIFSCNVWLFWSTPVATLAARRDRLTPGGVMAITHRPPAPGAGEDEAASAAERIAADLVAAGYADVRCEPIALDGAPAVCVIGRRPPAV